MANEWGPLWALAGQWEGEGVDKAFSHAKGEVLDIPYKEKTTLKPFGPVGNGSQNLYGLDYKAAMWRWDEENPFHIETGYWLWDAATGEVLKAFAVPRGITVLAGGIGISADATAFDLSAKIGDPQYGISENAYLGQKASSVSYDLNVTVNGDGTWTYNQSTKLEMVEFPELFAHDDQSTLHKVADL
jgi:hypothetical protein